MHNRNINNLLILVGCFFMPFPLVREEDKIIYLSYQKGLKGLFSLDFSLVLYTKIRLPFTMR